MPPHRQWLKHSAAAALPSALAVTLAAAILTPWPAMAQAPSPVKPAAQTQAQAQASLQTQNSDMLAGAEAWRRGDDIAAVRAWQPLAERGNADAQFNMGQAFKLGRGVAQDIAMAEIWYRRSASQGHLQAEDNLGLILFASGQRGAAMHYIRKSAARGEARAMFLLGTAHFNGDLAPQDWPRAYALTLRASQTGLSLAASRVAELDILIPQEQRDQGLALIQQLVRAEEEARQAATGTIVATAPATPSANGTGTNAAAQTASPAPENIARPGVAPAAPIQMVDIAPSVMQANLDAAELIEPEMRPAARPKAGVTFTPPPLPAPRNSTSASEAGPEASSAPPTGPATEAASQSNLAVPAESPAANDQAAAGPPTQPKIIDLPPSNSAPQAPISPAVPISASPAASAPTTNTAPAPAAPQPATKQAPKPASKAASATGPWRLQLGAFSQSGNAQRMWSQLSAQHQGIARRKPIITTNGRLTMLYAGEFSSRADAVNLCNQLKSNDQSCIVLD